MKGAKAIRPLWLNRCAGFLALLLLSLLPAHAEPPIRFSGELGGLVTDVAGKPQPGAIVLLFNKQDRLLQRSATDSLRNLRFRRSVARPVFRSRVPFQFRAGHQGSHPDQAGDAQPSRRQSFARVQFGTARFHHARLRQLDERQLEVGAARRQFDAADPSFSPGPAARPSSGSLPRVPRSFQTLVAW